MEQVSRAATTIEWLPDSSMDASRLKARCQRVHGWSDEYCDRVLQGFRQFMTLKLAAEDWDASLLSPSPIIDQMWHLHILDTKGYQEQCQSFLQQTSNDNSSQLIHHDPDGGCDFVKRSSRRNATAVALRIQFGKANFDSEIWSMNESVIKNFDSEVLTDSSGEIGQLALSESSRETFEVNKPKTKRMKCSNFESHAARHAPPDEEPQVQASAEGPHAQVPAEEPEEPAPPSELITISFEDPKDERRPRLAFRVKPTRRVSSFFMLYAHVVGKEYGTLRFLLDGEKLCSPIDETLQDFGLKDGDIIHIIHEQSGC